MVHLIPNSYLLLRLAGLFHIYSSLLNNLPYTPHFFAVQFNKWQILTINKTVVITSRDIMENKTQTLFSTISSLISDIKDVHSWTSLKLKTSVKRWHKCLKRQATNWGYVFCRIYIWQHLHPEYIEFLQIIEENKDLTGYFTKEDISNKSVLHIISHQGNLN